MLKLPPVMPIYTYETIPRDPGAEPVRFELRQSMRDDPLKEHPETGEPVRRVITGGYGIMGSSRTSGGTTGAGGHGSSCGCGST